MHSHVLKSVSRVLVLAAATALPVALAAQDAPQPAPKVSAADSPSKWDIFAGYSYLSPRGTVYVPQTNGTTTPYYYTGVNIGAILSGARYYNNWLGVEVEGATHGTFHDDHGENDGFTTIQGGLIVRFPGVITPYVHGLIGGADVAGPAYEPYKWGMGLTGGAGLDFRTPWRHVSFRLVQADYQYMHVNWGPNPPSAPNYSAGGRSSINAIQLSTGLVFHIGTIAPPPPVTLACSASPTSVFPGDPVTLTATTGGGDPKMTPVVTWSGVEGVSGTGTTVTVKTDSLAAGSYTAKCDAKEGKPGKEGMKPWEVATGTATFTVKAFEPPTISCTASPSTIKPGDSSTVTCTGMSPQNRPLTYAYKASAGSVNGSGTTATFNSTGAPTGTATITGTVTDDKGQSASSDATVTITAPYVPPTPHSQALCSITFDKDKARPTRVDNEAKACLDEVALDLQKQSDAKVVIIGESNAAEKEGPQHPHHKMHKEHMEADIAGERAVNTKEYLVTEKGIDASRITVVTGPGDDQKVEEYLVPAGANFGADVSGTTPVDESVVKPQTRKPLPARAEHHHKKHKADSK